MLPVPRYLLRINYKSGISEEFWVTEFAISNGNWTWKSMSGVHHPILMGVDAVESVWQLDAIT